MASRRQAKKKGKAAKNAEHGNVQASAAASRKKTPQEEIQQADGVQPSSRHRSTRKQLQKGKAHRCRHPENQCFDPGETLSMSSGASETESSGDAAQDNAGGAAAPQTKEEAPRKTAAKPDAPEIEEGADVQPGRLPKAKRMPRRRNRSPSLRRMRRTPERRTQMPVESWSCRTSRKGFRSFPPHRRPHIMRSRPPSRKLCRIKRHANRRDGITHCFIFRS